MFEPPTRGTAAAGVKPFSPLIGRWRTGPLRSEHELATITQKTRLEDALGMGSGYVLGVTDGSFQQFFADLGIDIYDTDKYTGLGTSKAKRLRALWQTGSNARLGRFTGLV